ncbi:response regulator [Sphingorhabdus sp.]|jgi:CheY-like chemotaxis protein/DNA-binding MarR family transcriptional regulator|uniref:response regulator n=1 Tax=Sphingorhabdus sp. TaxID=1902408 RepID=UPI003D8146DA
MHGDGPDSEMALRTASKGCTILVVDDDPACLDEYCDAIANLGYTVKSATSAPDALKQIAESQDIGVVITDVEMPTMDGISLLSEISNRFSLNRPIVTLVLTGHSSVQVATKAMQSQATDMLSKPVSIEQLAEALRRASAYHFAMANRFQITALTKRLDPPVVRDRPAKRNSRPTEEELQAFTRMLLKFQHNKSKFFDPAVLAGPSWEILLDIADATLRGEAVPASSASASTHVPLSTALRHVNNLVNAGLVRRWTDPTDKRRTLLELEPHAVAAMQRYLETAWKLQPQSE